MASSITLPNNINTTSTTNTNNYTADELATLQQKGCVFLPTTGYRSGITIYDQDKYWTSTHENNSNSFSIIFGKTYSLYTTSSAPRHNGCAVRLVADLE